MIDVVLDYLYNTDSEYKNAVDEFINEIPKINEWSNMKRVDILNYTYVDEDDIEVFIDTLNQITNENNQLNENTFRWFKQIHMRWSSGKSFNTYDLLQSEH